MALAASALVLSTTAVFADQVQADADTVVAGGQTSKAFGVVAAGAVLTPSVSFSLNCTSNKHVDNGQTVNIGFLATGPSGSTAPAGGSMTGTNATIGAIPALWPDDGNNCGGSSAPADRQDNGDSTLTIAVPTAPGNYTFIAKYGLGLSPAGTDDTGSLGAQTVTATYTMTVEEAVTDADGDGIADDSDNCPSIANPGQEDADDDDIGDVCDSNAFAPVVSVDAGSKTGVEGVAMTNSGAFTDADPGASISISLRTGSAGSLTDNNNGTWSWSYTAPDQSSGTVYVDATDGDSSHVATDSFTWSAANANPSQPGAPSVSVGSSPNNTGVFTLGWAASTDVPADTITYTLQHKDTDDLAYSTVASGIGTNSYDFTSSPESEGTWTYSVVASDEDGGVSAVSLASSAVVVDKTNPNAPNVAATTASVYTDGSSHNWWKDTVTVGFSSAGDPALVDTSAGSGVDPLTVTANQTFTALGVHTASGSLQDFAGNTSATASLDVYVDNSNPELGSCPVAGPFQLNSGDHSVGPIGATDTGSGVAASSTLTGTVHTNIAAQQSVTFTANDNVGHSVSTTCYYDIVRVTFLQPVDGGPTMNIAKLGRVIPVKVTVAINGSAVVPPATISISGVTKVDCSTGASSTDSIEAYAAAGASNSGNLFRWDTAGSFWIYNFDTSAFKLSVGNCYRVNVLSGGTVTNSVAAGGALAGYFLVQTTK